MAVFLGTLFIVICILLIIVVLLQKGRGGGLGAAFGGAGSSAFGTRTGDVFTWVTIVLTGLFLVLAIVTNFAVAPPAQTVAMPEFSPPEGPIREPVYVEIKCQTLKARIYYTLDGPEPTQDSTPYATSAILVKPGQMLRARAYRPGWDPSGPAKAEYLDARLLDTQPATTRPLTTRPVTAEPVEIE